MKRTRKVPGPSQFLLLVVAFALAVACSSTGSGGADINLDGSASAVDKLSGLEGVEQDTQKRQDGQLVEDTAAFEDAVEPGDFHLSDALPDSGLPDAGDVCVSNCEGKQCGPDGCGSQCGQCPDGPSDYCSDEGLCLCQALTCQQVNAKCGAFNDNCGGILECGECNEFPASYCDGGACDCAPDCSDKQCGDDGCAGSCGQCVCGNDLCEETEDWLGCPEDCGFCGDGICKAGEELAVGADSMVCLKDCHPLCGDEVCEDGESNQSCPYDCPECGDGICSPGEDAGCFFECSFSCGDGQCGGFFETPQNCPMDCPPVCGDSACSPPETVLDCPGDCALCGDGFCTEPENKQSCPADCDGQCGNGICEGSETPDHCAVDCGACPDGTCGFIETPQNCAADCAASCGDAECSEDETEETCPADCGCLPDCSGKQCGLDDCGFDCGSCPAYAQCADDNQCVCENLECGGLCCSPEAICWDNSCCESSCAGVQCGTDGCGGSCGDCPDLTECQQGQCACQFIACAEKCCQEGQTCNSGKCCTPDCQDKECGSDGCTGLCGQCGFAHECEDGQCVWQVFCGNGQCESGAGENCQTCDEDCNCSSDSVCQENGVCCPLQCEGKECGPDGCGGQCGVCQDLSTCTQGMCLCDFEQCDADCCQVGEVCHAGACCMPDCSNKDCGDDGCGGSCGDCPDGFSCGYGVCQCDSVIWTRNHGDKDSDIIYGISPMEGGYYFGGRSQALMSYHDFWVGGTNSEGYEQWEVTYNGSGSFSKDVSFAVATTPEGDAVAVGKQDTGLWFSGVARKVNSAGESVWGKTFGGNGLNEFRDVVVNEAGVAVMVGQVFSGYTYKGWLVALNPDGSTNGSKTYVGSGAFDVLRGIETVSAGGYVAVGCSGLQSIDNEDYVSPGQMWLLRLNDSFTVTWSAKLHGSAEGFAVAETADGFIVAGYKWNGSNRDIVVVRTDSSGSKMWEQVLGWGGDDVAKAVTVTPNGGFLVTGYARPPQKSDTDMYIFEMSPAGAVLWQMFVGGSSTQAGHALTPVPGEPGNYLAGGRNGSDAWMVKFGSCY
jgi:hypothetical protein